MSLPHSIPAHNGSPEITLEHAGDWRSFLLKQYIETVELFSRQWSGQGEEVPGTNVVDVEQQSKLASGAADAAAPICCSSCGNALSPQEAVADWPKVLDPEVTACAERALAVFTGRSLSEDDYVVLWIDSAYVLNTQFVFCMGATLTGHKRALSFVASSLEDSAALAQMFQRLLARGFNTTRGALCVMSGAVGLYQALRECFSNSVQVQRCHAQKRRRVLSYLPQERRLTLCNALRHAWQTAHYDLALQALKQVQREVALQNMTAGRCLQEGLEETLTLHRAGVFPALGRPLKTTRMIGHIAAGLSKRLRRYASWMPPEQRDALMALGLLEMESRMYRVAHAPYLSALRSNLFSSPPSL